MNFYSLHRSWVVSGSSRFSNSPFIKDKQTGLIQQQHIIQQSFNKYIIFPYTRHKQHLLKVSVLQLKHSNVCTHSHGQPASTFFVGEQLHYVPGSPWKHTLVQKSDTNPQLLKIPVNIKKAVFVFRASGSVPWPWLFKMNKIHNAYQGAVHVCHIPSSQQLWTQRVGACWRHIKPLSLSLAALWTVKETQEVVTFHCQVMSLCGNSTCRSSVCATSMADGGRIASLGKVTTTPDRS